MEQENAAEKIEGTPKKQPQTIQTWILFGCVLLLSALCLFQAILGIVMTQKRSCPPNSGNLQGTIEILDENGNAVPYRDTTLTFFSLYAGSSVRCEANRKRNLYVDAEGFGNRVPLAIPEFPATLFFHTRNGKYAAVVDLAEGEPTTGLAVTLRPRHSATGRLLDRSGTPLANYEFSLNFQRTPEIDRSLPFGRSWATVETFEFVYGETDADGYFTVDRLIPGLEYNLRTHQPKDGGGYTNVTMPILQPEQYQEPFDLGDVFTRPGFTVPPSAR